MRSKDSKAKDKLKRHMSVSGNHQVLVTERKIRYWFGVINDAAFGGKLSVPRLRAKSMRDDWGFCWPKATYVEFVINSNIVTRDLFIGTVAHEMVHLWQHERDTRLNHADTFIRWKKHFKKRYGIVL